MIKAIKFIISNDIVIEFVFLIMKPVRNLLLLFLRKMIVKFLFYMMRALNFVFLRMKPITYEKLLNFLFPTSKNDTDEVFISNNGIVELCISDDNVSDFVFLRIKLVNFLLLMIKL